MNFRILESILLRKKRKIDLETKNTKLKKAKSTDFAFFAN
jgi:hypothetical protein